MSSTLAWSSALYVTILCTRCCRSWQALSPAAFAPEGASLPPSFLSHWGVLLCLWPCCLVSPTTKMSVNMGQSKQVSPSLQHSYAHHLTPLNTTHTSFFCHSLFYFFLCSCLRLERSTDHHDHQPNHHHRGQTARRAGRGTARRSAAPATRARTRRLGGSSSRGPFSPSWPCCSSSWRSCS